MNLDNHILQALKNHPDGHRPLTIGDLARQLGANPFVVGTAARRLVDSGLATGAMVSVNGVATLRGLTPLASGTPH